MDDFQSRFERMTKQSKASEDLVCSYLELRHNLGFHLSTTQSQKDGVSKGWHVPDILCSSRENTTIEVKEDISCGKTGNLAFEEKCLINLKRWSQAHNKPNMFLAYVNHQDFQLDFFQCGHDVDKLIKELEWLCVLRPDCKEVMGGDQAHKLWIIPLKVARSMVGCTTKSIISIQDNFGFSIIAKRKLSK